MVNIWWAMFHTNNKLSFPNGEREKEEPDNQSLIERKKYVVPKKMGFLSSQSWRNTRVGMKYRFPSLFSGDTFLINLKLQIPKLVV